MADAVNDKTIAWARSKLGQQVGTGECWDLPDQALRNAGGTSSTTTGKRDDYVWGDLIQLKDVRPGDILQFRDFRVTTTTNVDVTFLDKSGYEQPSESFTMRGHHVAIVEAVVGAGQIRVLEQNVKPLGRRVQQHVIYTSDGGPKKTTSQKLLKHASGKVLSATVVETTTIKVTGRVWAYRPKPN